MALFRKKKKVPSADEAFFWIRNASAELALSLKDPDYQNGDYRGIVECDDDIMVMFAVFLFVAVTFPTDNERLVSEVDRKIVAYLHEVEATLSQHALYEASYQRINTTIDAIARSDQTLFRGDPGLPGILATTALTIMNRRLEDYGDIDKELDTYSKMKAYISLFITVVQEKLY